jgi:hypothetical protein
MKRPVEHRKKIPGNEDNRTGMEFVEAMRQGRRLGLKLKPMKYYPTYRPPVSFSDEER